MRSSQKMKPSKEPSAETAAEGANLKPTFLHSLSSARADALLARMRGAVDLAGTQSSAHLPQSSSSAAGSPTMYTTLNGFSTTTGSPTLTTTKTATMTTARASEALVGQVQVLVEQVSGAHQGPSHRVRRIRLAQELLSGCAALGLTPSMVLAGVPVILEQFALATVTETPIEQGTVVASQTTAATMNGYSETMQSTTRSVFAAAPPKDTTSDSLVGGGRLLPPLVDQVQLLTDDGVDAMAMDAFLSAAAADSFSPTQTLTKATSAVAGPAAPAAAEATTTLARADADVNRDAFMLPDATAADILIALLELCGKPLTYLTLQDQQCLPMAIEALALSCSLIATRLDTTVLLLDEQDGRNGGDDDEEEDGAESKTSRTHATVASSLSKSKAHTRGGGGGGGETDTLQQKERRLMARVRVLHRVRLAALAAIEQLLKPLAAGAMATGGLAETDAPLMTKTATRAPASTVKPASASHRRRERSSTSTPKPVFKVETRGSISRAISTPAIAAATTTTTTRKQSAASVSSPVYEATVVGAALGAMDVDGFVCALSGPLLERWASILREAVVVVSSATTERVDDTDEMGRDSGSGCPPQPSSQMQGNPSRRPGHESQPSGDRHERDGADFAQELLVVSYLERLRLDSAHLYHHTTPEDDLCPTGKFAATPSKTQEKKATHPTNSSSSSDDEDDKDAPREASDAGRKDMFTTCGRGGASNASVQSSTDAAHDRRVLSRREEDEIGHILRIFGHLFTLLGQSVNRKETWRTLLAPSSTSAMQRGVGDAIARGAAPPLHPLLPVLAVRTLSRAVPGDYCASLAMGLLSWMMHRAPHLVSRALLYHEHDAALFKAFDLDRPVGDLVEEEDEEQEEEKGEEEEEVHRDARRMMEAAFPEPCALESLFDALVVQLNASHRLAQRELRNDLLTVMTTVLSEDATTLRQVGLARRQDLAGRAQEQQQEEQRKQQHSANTTHAPRGASKGVASPRPLPPRVVDAVNAVVLTIFNLLCSSELNLVVANEGDGEKEGERHTRATMADTASATMAMLEYQLPLLSAQTLSHYTLRFNGVASPSQRRELLQFKRLGWQLLASFCEWQAARVYFEGSRYAPRAMLASAPASVSRQVGRHASYEGLHLVDLSLLGFLDALLLYVDVHCRIPVVVAWTQEELVALQDEAWQLMISLVENGEELRSLFALDYNVFAMTLQAAAANNTADKAGNPDYDDYGDLRSSSLRSGSFGGGASGAMFPDERDLAAALKASSRFSSAAPPRRTSILLTDAASREAEHTAVLAAVKAVADREHAASDDVHSPEAQPLPPVMPSVLKGPDVHLLEAGVVDVALHYVRHAPVLVEPLKHKAVQLLDAIARSSSTTSPSSWSPGVEDPSAGVLAAASGTASRPAAVSVHMSLNARLSVQKYAPTLVRALLARTPGLVKLLVHILRELQHGASRVPPTATATQITKLPRTDQTNRSRGTNSHENNTNNADGDLLSFEQGVRDDQGNETNLSLNFLESASSSLLALVCVHFLQCLGESAKEEVGGIHELEALRNTHTGGGGGGVDEKLDMNNHYRTSHQHGRKQAKRTKASHASGGVGEGEGRHSFVAAASGEVTVVDMGYDSEAQEEPSLADAAANAHFSHAAENYHSDQDDAQDQDWDGDDDEYEDDEEDNIGTHHAPRAHANSLKPMAVAPTEAATLASPRYPGASFQHVMKLGYEFEDAGGVALLVAWMRILLTPSPAEASAIGARLDLTGTASVNQATLLATAVNAVHGAQPRAPPLQESHLFRHLDMLVALFGVLRGLILGSEHTEQAFVKAGGVSVMLDAIEALAIAGNALLPIPDYANSHSLETTRPPNNSNNTTSGAEETRSTARQHTDPEASPAALARLKEALLLAMVPDPAPLAAAAQGDRAALIARRAAFTDALRYALTLLSELLYTSEMACEGLLHWRSRRLDKYALSTGGAMPVRTTHDVFMNAVQLLISIWSTALTRHQQNDGSNATTTITAAADASATAAGAPAASLAGLDVLRVRVREPARALLREEYVRRFLRAKLTHLYPEKASPLLDGEMFAKSMTREGVHQFDGGAPRAERRLVNALADLLLTLGMEELLRYYFYATGQEEDLEVVKAAVQGDATTRDRADEAEEADDDEHDEAGTDQENADDAVAVSLSALRKRRARQCAMSKGDMAHFGTNDADVSLASVLTREEKAHVLNDMATRVAISDAESERHRQVRLGLLLHNALGLGEKVYSCIASLGFEHLISHPSDAPTQAASTSASSLYDRTARSHMHAAGDMIALSPSERSHLISIAALPALCMDELCVAMANVAAVTHEDAPGRRPGASTAATDADAATSTANPQSPRSQATVSASGLVPIVSPLSEAPAMDAGVRQARTVRMRPTSPDRRCLQGVLTDVYARGHEIGQLVHLGHEASQTQEQQLYDRFLVTRLRQPVAVLKGNAHTLLAMRDAMYGTDGSGAHHSTRRHTFTSRRRSSALYEVDAPHVVVPLSPGAATQTSSRPRSNSPNPKSSGSGSMATPATADGGMSALAARLASRMIQSQREQEARQLIHSLSAGPTATAGAAAVAADASYAHAPRKAATARDMLMSVSGQCGSQQQQQQARSMPSSSPAAAGRPGAGTAAPMPPSRQASQAPSAAAAPPRAPQPPPPRPRALVEQRKKKEAMVRNSLKRLPQQKDQKPSDPSTLLVDAVLKDVRHTNA